jgi:hypothetical protein
MALILKLKFTIWYEYTLCMLKALAFNNLYSPQRLANHFVDFPDPKITASQEMTMSFWGLTAFDLSSPI